jgi:hypothetical protein
MIAFYHRGMAYDEALAGRVRAALPIATATISARPRDRCRGGGGGWVQISGAGPEKDLRTSRV